MLRYLATGQRLRQQPFVPAQQQVDWEFLAVVRGSITLFLGENERLAPTANRLWLFPPGFVYQWSCDKDAKCELIAIHFNSVPSIVVQIVAARGPISAPLNPAARAALRDLARKLKRHYWHPVRQSELHVDRALMDLSLLALHDYEESQQPLRTGDSLEKVVRAEKWLYDRLPENPSIADAAVEIGLSTSQLNRLFHQARKESPQQVLNRLKIDRAMELLASSNAKLHSVATESGFSNASNLCRAFKRMKGHSPTLWRQKSGQR